MDTDAVLHSWHTLLPVISQANEDECQELLKAELEGRRRRRMLLRVHSRLNKLRAHRERDELIEQAVAP